jgi:hypothetical protein
MDKILCPFCREPIDPDAKKCKHCHEFLVSKGNDRKDAVDGLEIYRITVDFLSKCSVPLVVLVALLIFRPIIDSLLWRTTEAEVLGSKLQFASVSAYSGFLSSQVEELTKQESPDEVRRMAIEIKETSDQILELHPLSLYYLIGSAGGGTLHYELVYLKHREYIEALREKGLATLEVVEGTSDDPFEGAKGLRIVPTAFGEEFLKRIGVEMGK